jgi:hypothetical protein
MAQPPLHLLQVLADLDHIGDNTLAPGLFGSDEGRHVTAALQAKGSSAGVSR